MATDTEMKTITKLIDTSINRPRSTLAAILLASAVFAYFFSQQTHNNHVEIFFEPDDPHFLEYRAFQEMYGNEEFAVIALSCDNIFTNARLARIRELTESLEAVPGVERVVSLTSMEEFHGSGDTVFLRPIVPEGFLTEGQLNATRKRAMENKIVRENFLSADGTMTALHVELESLKEKEKKRTVQAIVGTAEKLSKNQFGVYASGLSMVEVEMNRLSENDFMTFIPVIIGLIFVCTVLLLRQTALAVISQINLLVILVWGVGFYVFCGEQFNMITTAMGAILLAIAIADSIHVLSHLQNISRNQNQPVAEAMRQTLGQVWLPCLFTSATTGAGFLSFFASDIRPVAILGLFTAIGVVMAFFLSITALPSLIVSFKAPIEKSLAKRRSKQANPSHADVFGSALVRIGELAVRKRGRLLLLFLLIMALTGIGIARLRFETNTIRYLPDSNPFKKDLAVIEQHFGGTIPYILLVRAENGRDFTHPEAVRLAETVQADLLKGVKQFTGAFSVVDYLKEFNQAFAGNDPAFHTVPDNQLDIADAYEIGDPEVLDRILSPDRREICITFRTVWDSNEAAYALNDFVRDYMREKLPKSFSYSHTGLSTLYLTMDKLIQESQVKSFLIAFIIIFFMMLFICRNLKLALLSMVPNLFPIVITLGVMGWFGIPLDVATTMIASVTIGIAVDDTIHFISWLRRNHRDSGDVEAAIVKTFADVGKPITITTLLLFLGFFVLILGNILPTQAFGVLTAFSMLFALIGDLFFLPALILVLKPSLNSRSEP